MTIKSLTAVLTAALFAASLTACNRDNAGAGGSSANQGSKSSTGSATSGTSGSGSTSGSPSGSK